MASSTITASMSSVAACCSHTVSHSVSSSVQLPLLLTNGRTPRNRIGFPSSSVSGQGAKQSRLCIRATVTEESTAMDASKQMQELFEDIKAKYDSLENKSTVWIYGGGALVALWFSSAVIGAVNNVPLLPKVLELIGLGYSGWFVYRYLLFKSSRKQLAEDFEELKMKVLGVPKSAFMTEDDE